MARGTGFDAAFEHVRQVHFLLIALSATVLYVSYSARTDIGKVADDLHEFSALSEQIAHADRAPEPFLSALNAPWVEWQETRTKDALKEAFDHYVIVDSGVVAHLDDRQPGPTWSDHDPLSTIRERFDRATVAVSALVPGTGPVDAETRLSFQPAPETQTSFTGLVVERFDVAAKRLHVRYEVYERPVGAMDPNTGLIKPSRQPPRLLSTKDILLPAEYEPAAVGYQPTFEERFPHLLKNWSELGHMTQAEAVAHVSRRTQMAWASKRAKVFDLEIEGEDIALFGSAALLLTLWYFSAHLSSIRSYAVTPDFQSAVTSAPPMWIGVQRSKEAVALLWLSILAAPIAIYLGYFQIATNMWLSMPLTIVGIGLSARAGFTIAAIRELLAPQEARTSG